MASLSRGSLSLRPPPLITVEAHVVRMVLDCILVVIKYWYILKISVLSVWTDKC